MPKVIDMARCPYCETYVVAEEELVCEQCVDKVEADLACDELLTALERLEKMGGPESEAVKSRRFLLEAAYNRLAELLDE